MTTCPTCGCCEITELGALGMRTHFRCNCCGMDFSAILGTEDEVDWNDPTLDIPSES